MMEAVSIPCSSDRQRQMSEYCVRFTFSCQTYVEEWNVSQVSRKTCSAQTGHCAMISSLV